MQTIIPCFLSGTWYKYFITRFDQNKLNFPQNKVLNAVMQMFIGRRELDALYRQYIFWKSLFMKHLDGTMYTNLPHTYQL